jgi:hypothetical protein
MQALGEIEGEGHAMQELFRADGHSGSGLHERDEFAPGPLPAAGSREDRLVREQLNKARVLAVNGECRMARVLCADVVFDHQLRLARDRELRRCAIATLIHARGFQLLSRLLAAVDGWRVRVSLATGLAAAVSPPHLIGRSEALGATTFTVSERLYRDPSRGAVIDRWSEELARGRERRAAR